MGSGESYTVMQVSPEDLRKLMDDTVAALTLRSFLNRFENVLVGTNDIAKIHSVNPRTVLSYVKDGLIEPEAKLSENDHHRFRLSYALTLDFKELRKQLRAKNEG